MKKQHDLEFDSREKIQLYLEQAELYRKKEKYGKLLQVLEMIKNEIISNLI